MRIVTVRIEDNTGKITEVQNLINQKKETENNLLSEIDKLQKDAFMQILTYIKCACDDYLAIVGKVKKINDVSGVKNSLDVSNLSRSLRICANMDGVFIDFNYTGTPNCRNTPPRMKAYFYDGEIRILQSTREGIQDLMGLWSTIKPKFQEEISKAYERQMQETKLEINNLNHLLKTAQEFVL